MNELTNRTLLDHSLSLEKKEYSSEELTGAYLEKTETYNNDINAFITVCAEKALAAAKESDKRRLRGESLGALDGIPTALKDNICTEGIRTTCASKMLENYTPIYTATAAKRLIDAGAVILGKLNMDEFAMGSTGETSYFGAVKNPLDTTLTAGGSSSGSAAAVAAGLIPYSLGSDTGGSVRQPAAFCGLVGMKPTYARVSRYGLIAFASSLDQIGVISKTARDNATVLNTISGHDPLDPTSSPLAVEDMLAKTGMPLSGITVGIVRELVFGNISKEASEATLSAANKLSELGATIKEVPLPNLDDALRAYYIISSAEASSNLSRFDGVRFGHRSAECQSIGDLYTRSRSEGFGNEVKRRIMLGTFVLSSGYFDEYYTRAQNVRERIKKELALLFESCQLLLSPTAPGAAYPLFAQRSSVTDVWAEDICTVFANIAGLPALTLPHGKNKNGLPLGVQLISSPFSEAIIYQAAHALESAKEEKNEGIRYRRGS